MRRRRWLVLAVLCLTTLVAVMLPLALAWEEAVRANPALRPPETWTEEDLHTLFFDPSLHWCRGHHGCRHALWDWQRSTRCKGHVYGIIRQLERARTPAAERLVVELVAHPLPDVAELAAETCGIWKLAAAAPALRARLHEALRTAPDAVLDEKMVVVCTAWALEHLGAKEALDELKSGVGQAPWYLQHAIDVLEGRVTCRNCPAPHRK